MVKDPRVESAISHWAPRFISNGVLLADFQEVTNRIDRWENWCSAWSAHAAVHESLGREALTEVLTGRADMYFAPVFSVGAHIKDGKLRALAMGSPKRSALMPEVPTTVEAGYPNSDYNFWIGALVAAKTPREIVLRLNREINAAVTQ